jgi:PAS domain S-box-containing protein
MSDHLPKFIHDTHRIIDVNPAGCVLFRSEAISLVDSDMMDLIASDDFRGLARLRMSMLRDQGRWPLPDIKLPFRRSNGSVFWASIKTDNLNDGRYETTVFFESEA